MYHLEEFLLTNYISTGYRFIDIMFLSNWGLMCLAFQLIPYAFVKTYVRPSKAPGARPWRGEQAKKLNQTFAFIFACVAATCSSIIFISYEKNMPIYSGICDTYMYSDNFIILYAAFVTQRMLVHIFQIVMFEDISKLMGKLLLFHHMIIFIGGSFGLQFDTMAFYFTSYAMAEVSTVFLNFKDFYKNVLGINNKRLDTINLVLFFVTFFIFRVLYMPYRHISDILSYRMCGRGYIIPLFLNGLSFPISLLSYYWWFWEICPLAMKKLKRT